VQTTDGGHFERALFCGTASSNPAPSSGESCEPDFLGSDFREGQVAMARLVTSSCTGASHKLCGRSVVNWGASVHSTEAVIGVTG
jgi:hypothetical protein